MQNVNRCVNQPAKLSKRLLSGIIELIMIIFFSYLLFNFVAKPVANKYFDYDKLNDTYNIKVSEYYTIADEKYDLGEYKDSSFTANDNAESGNPKYEAFLKDEEVISLTKEIQSLQTKINNTSNYMVICSSLIPELIFWLIIPLMNKRKKSLGMIITKLYLIHRDDMKVTNKQLIYRFLSLFLIQTALCYVFFGITAIFMSPLLSVLCMYSSINRYAIHDLVAKTKVVDHKTKVVDQEPILFATIEERDNYLLFNSSKKKNAIDVSINDSSDKKEKFELIEGSNIPGNDGE